MKIYFEQPFKSYSSGIVEVPDSELPAIAEAFADSSARIVFPQTETANIKSDPIEQLRLELERIQANQSDVTKLASVQNLLSSYDDKLSQLDTKSANAMNRANSAMTKANSADTKAETALEKESIPGKDGKDAPTLAQIAEIIPPLIPPIVAPLIPQPISGKDGHTPTTLELAALIAPLIPAPIPGKDGKDADMARVAALETFRGKFIDKTHVQPMPLVALGGLYNFAVTVTGAVIGANVLVNCSTSLGGAVLEGIVSAANTVTVYLKAGIAIAAGNKTFYISVKNPL